MSEHQLLLPDLSGNEAACAEHSNIAFENSRVLISNYDISQYAILNRVIGKRWYRFSEGSNRGVESAYSHLFNAYGTGYIDAARRYRNDGIFDLGRSTRSEESIRSDTVGFRFSRLSFAFFSTFIVLAIVSVVIVVRGLLASSEVTIELAVVSLGVSLCAGLAWLRRAEVEQQRARAI